MRPSESLSGSLLKQRRVLLTAPEMVFAGQLLNLTFA
jgi:hypothetical protein